MGTLESEVNDLFLSRVSDYRLNTIFTTSGSRGLNTYLEPYLLDSIVEFDVCNQTLVYTPTSGSTEGYFNLDLNIKNKIILSRLMVKYWMDKDINNILSMAMIIQDHDMKTYSQAQNLDAKRRNLIAVKEELSQLLIDYGFKNNNWIEWKNQNFD